MLESRGNGSRFQNTHVDSVPEPWSKLFGALFADVGKISRRLFGLGRTKDAGRMDAEIQENVSTSDKNVIMSKVEEVQSREDIFSKCYFEWVKTEKQGDVSMFQHFILENDVEYVVFQDGSRIRTDLLGDIVLMHSHPSEIIGDVGLVAEMNPQESIQELKPAQDFSARLMAEAPVNRAVPTEIDPVLAILDKTKKKTEKVTLTLTLKIPAPDLYNVIKENFDNTDEILLENVMDQIHDSLLRDALRKELAVIYAQKRKKPQ